MIALKGKAFLHSGIISRFNIAHYKAKHYKKIYYVSAYEVMTMDIYYNIKKLIIGRGNGYVIYDLCNLYFVTINEFEDLFEIIDKNCHSQINVKIENYIHKKFNITYDIVHNLTEGCRITFERCYFPTVKLIPSVILYSIVRKLEPMAFPTVQEAEKELLKSLKACLYTTYRISGILPDYYLISKNSHHISYLC